MIARTGLGAQLRVGQAGRAFPGGGRGAQRVPVAERAGRVIVAATGEETEAPNPMKAVIDKAFGEVAGKGYHMRFPFTTEVETPEKADGTKMSFAEYLDATEEERAAKRAVAAKELVNIDETERERRIKIGSVLLAGTFVAAALMVNAHADTFTRAGLILPSFFGYAFIRSGQAGM